MAGPLDQFPALPREDLLVFADVAMHHNLLFSRGFP